MSDRERDLVRRWQAHQDRAALDVLVQTQLPYVERAAKHFFKYLKHAPYEDLVSAGLEGVLTAIDRFDTTREARLITYAGHWIKARMVDTIMREWSRGKTAHPGARSRLFWQARRVRARLLGQGYTEEVALAKAARELHVSRERLQIVWSLFDRPDFSLDVPSEDGTPIVGKALTDRATPSVETMVIRREEVQQARTRLEEAFAPLTDRERWIIECRYLADRDKRMTLAVLGQELGISRERVRQLEVLAFEKMRRVLLNRNDLKN